MGAKILLWCAIVTENANKTNHLTGIEVEKWLQHTYPFNGPLSGTTRVSLHQKGKTNVDFTEARDYEWQ